MLIQAYTSFKICTNVSWHLEWSFVFKVCFSNCTFNGYTLTNRSALLMPYYWESDDLKNSFKLLMSKGISHQVVIILTFIQCGYHYLKLNSFSYFFPFLFLELAKKITKNNWMVQIEHSSTWSTFLTIRLIKEISASARIWWHKILLVRWKILRDSNPQTSLSPIFLRRLL